LKIAKKILEDNHKVFKNKLVFVIALALVSGVLSVNAVVAKTSDALKVSLNFEKTAFGYDESVPVNVSITNENKSSVKILRWLTPFDGVKEDLFVVTVDGKPVEYIGAHYKRPAPTAKDYITLKSGETFDATVDLAGYYDLSQTGFYQVNYRVEAANIFSPNTSLLDQSDSLKSGVAQTYIEGREAAPMIDVPDAVSGSTSYTGCSTSRQSSLVTARNNASTYANNSYLNAGTVGARYTTWFGTYSSSRYSTVRSHFSNIRSAMDTASVRFNCTCTDSAYAYVYPTQPYTIYLCNAFWSAGSTETDSKAGTLVHEMSHFNVVAGTDDWAYGQSAARNLARTNTTRAVDNADSHEYFAENTPAQQ
jgi:peptidyl-Lys metalloendopeptidase